MTGPMDQQTPANKPHWAWPHAIAIVAGIVAYIVIFRYTGDADVLYTIALAVAMGGAAWVAAWTYLFRARR